MLYLLCFITGGAIGMGLMVLFVAASDYDDYEQAISVDQCPHRPREK